MAKPRKKLRLRKNVLILGFILLIAIAATISYSVLTKDKLKVSYDKSVEISLNSESYNTDYIHKVKNGKLITEKEKIDTSSLGTKTITIVIEDNNKKQKEYTITVNIVDKEAPKITYTKDLEINMGATLEDILKTITVTDNSNEEITPTIEGDYDLDVSGTYNLQIIAKDSSGNITKEELSLTIKDDGIVRFTTSKGFKGEVIDGVTYIDGYMIANKTYSLPSTYKPSNTYADPAKNDSSQCPKCLTKTTYDQWEKMQAGAAAAGHTLRMVSAYRSYNLQNTLYKRQVDRQGKAIADTVSARPGYSEHQTGLSFDTLGDNYSALNTEYGKKPSAIWLANNCYKYGFILRYPEGKTDITGYIYEPWHFRYVGVELATKLYNNGDWITMEEYFGITSEYTD